MQAWISYVFGYFFAVIIGHWCISWIVSTLWGASGWLEDNRVRPFGYSPSLVGLVERTLYLISLQLAHPEFIAVWLAMKVAGQWKRWEEGATIRSTSIPGRAFYNFFLIGTGFSIAYSAAGYAIIYSLNNNDYFSAIATPVVVLASTICFVLLTKYYQKQKRYNAINPDKNA